MCCDRVCFVQPLYLIASAVKTVGVFYAPYLYLSVLLAVVPSQTWLRQGTRKRAHGQKILNCCTYSAK